MEGGDDFSVFQGKKNIKKHYVEVQADNNYIYALYWGKERWGMHEIPYVNTIHVFDWHGKLIQKLETDYDIDKMFLDTVRDRLCVTRPIYTVWIWLKILLCEMCVENYCEIQKSIYETIQLLLFE